MTRLTNVMSNLPKIAIAMGDPAGIGPEIALKAILDSRVRAVCRPLLVGDLGALQRHAQACGVLAPVEVAQSFEEAGSSGEVEMIALRCWARSVRHTGGQRWRRQGRQ